MPDFFETSKFVNKILGMKKGVIIFNVALVECNCRFFEVIWHFIDTYMANVGKLSMAAKATLKI